MGTILDSLARIDRNVNRKVLDKRNIGFGTTQGANVESTADEDEPKGCELS